MALFREFLNENIHRAYPFAAQNQIPTGLLVDFGIICTENVLTDSVYIKNVTTDGVAISFSLAVTIDSVEIDLGVFATVAIDTELFKRTDFKILNAENNIVMEGFITTGDLRVCSSMSPVTVLDAATGEIYNGCIQPMTSWVAGVKIGNTLLSGVVEFVAGAGVEFVVAGQTVTINTRGANQPPSNSLITSDADILTALNATYGTPVVSINGVAPVDGNIQISTPVGSNLTITTTTAGISVADSNNTPCCSKTDIQTLVDNIAGLNARIGTISTFQSALDNNINVISTQLTRLN